MSVVFGEEILPFPKQNLISILAEIKTESVFGQTLRSFRCVGQVEGLLVCLDVLLVPEAEPCLHGVENNSLSSWSFLRGELEAKGFKFIGVDYDSFRVEGAFCELVAVSIY